jgi:dCMP deaminase
MNAIISASRLDMLGATLYVMGRNNLDEPIDAPMPCYLCRRMIVNAGLYNVKSRLLSGVIVCNMVSKFIENDWNNYLEKHWS